MASEKPINQWASANGSDFTHKNEDIQTHSERKMRAVKFEKRFINSRGE